MGRGIIKRLLGGLGEMAAGVPEKRQASNALKFSVTDALLCAAAVFYFQHPSLLNFQQAMKSKQKRCNLETLFGIKDIPCTEQIKNIVDDIEPEGLRGAFESAFGTAREHGIVDGFRTLSGGVLIALDGTWYFSSKEIHCEHCLTMTSKKRGGEEEKTYYHDVLAAVMVNPDSRIVFPLFPEFIRNEDGAQKQDCERNAAKRWFKGNLERYSTLNPTYLGDDLFACHSICKQITADGKGHFLFTCKDESHPWIAEQIKYSYLETFERREWNGRAHFVHRYSWRNGIENRADGGSMPVNYLRLETYNEEKKEIIHTFSWITDHKITAENAMHIAKCARTRWKIENENNNVLKHHGYNLKHNFGHGENHASEIFCLLNLLMFLFHNIQAHIDDDYKKAKESFGRRVDFFWALRYEICRYLHETWETLFLTVSGNAPDG